MMRLTWTVTLAALLVGGWGCAHEPIGKEVVWPEPPDRPRVKFVRAFRQNDELNPSAWSAFLRTLFGGTREPALSQPMGVAVSKDGQRVYIADHAHTHIFLADFENKKMGYFAPDESFGKPFNVALDADENVYVSDTVGAVVIVLDKSGKRIRTIGQGQLERPTGLAIDHERRRLYVSDSASLKSPNHRVRAFDLAGGHLHDLRPKNGPPAKGSEDGHVFFPGYLAVASDGQVYVADAMNFRIQVFDTDGKFVRKYGDHGDGPGFFARIKGLAFDSFGNLYVVDGGHSNVQIFNRNFDVLMFFGGYAQKLEFFDIPSGIAIHQPSNTIFVCNEFISRVNVYSLFNTSADDSDPSAPSNQPPAAGAQAPAPAAAPKAD